MKKEKERNDNLILNEETSGAEVLSTSDSKKAATPKLGITIAVVLVLVVIMAVALTSCSKKNNNKDNQVTNNTPKVEDTVEVNSTEEVEVPEVEVESTEEVEDEPVAEQTMEEWLTEIGSKGTICMAVWNDKNSTKHIIENDETYERQDDDKFFICMPSKFKECNCIVVIGNEFGKPTDNYLEVTFESFSGEEDITYEVICSGGEEGKIHFTLVSSGTAVAPSTTVDEDIPGFYWAGDLGYDTSKIVVWNDAKGFKQVLDEGATYQLCEGDELAVYLPENYTYNSSNIEGNLSLVINLILVDVNELEIGDKLDFEITTCNTETSETITSHVTLLPIQ